MKRKGRTFAMIDGWLDTLGFYRKNVAYDETCLFRAVSEQLFASQIYHERVRKECVQFAKQNPSVFRNQTNFWKRLEDLENHMVLCGDFEIQLISQVYRRDVYVFNANTRDIQNVTNHDFEQVLRLCLVKDDHYDVIYEKEHIENAGFCQSIVYNVLYEDVFSICNASEIAKSMLYDEEPTIFTGIERTDTKGDNDVDDCTVATQSVNSLAPFPFKIAKALDPTIYRNIEYDTWIEMRREMRLGEWYYGDDKLILGTRCTLQDNRSDQMLECYIQEIRHDQKICVVYVTKLAEKRMVNYKDLAPEDDAKPWPLPYRFSKHQQSSISTSVTGENEVQTKRSSTTTLAQLKLLTKRPVQNGKVTNCPNGSGDEGTPSNDLCNKTDIISKFTGMSLQMMPVQKSLATPSAATNPVDTDDPVPSASNQSQKVVFPDPSVPLVKYQSQWNPLVGLSQMSPQESVIWTAAPPTPNLPTAFVNYIQRPPPSTPAICSPDVAPYAVSDNGTEANTPVFYYPQWQDPAEQIVSDIQPETDEEQEPISVLVSSPPHETTVQCSYFTSPAAQVNQTSFYSQPPPVTAVSELYSPLIPLPPGTPLIFQPPPPSVTPTTANFLPELLMTSPHPPPPPHPATPLSHSARFQTYMPSPPQIIYPTTPNATTVWFPPGVGAQGFIFPPPGAGQHGKP